MIYFLLRITAYAANLLLYAVIKWSVAPALPHVSISRLKSRIARSMIVGFCKSRRSLWSVFLLAVRNLMSP